MSSILEMNGKIVSEFLDLFMRYNFCPVHNYLAPLDFRILVLTKKSKHPLIKLVKPQDESFEIIIEILIFIFLKLVITLISAVCKIFENSKYSVFQHDFFILKN